MGDGWSAATANAILRAQFRGDPYVETTLLAQLHVGAPGAAGTTNVAVNNTRVDAAPAFATDPVGNTITNDGAIGPWPAATVGETYTHVTLWSLSGTFIGSGAITSAAVTVGDAYSVPPGDCTAVVPIAS